MTDLEKLKTLFDQWGVEYVLTVDDGDYTITTTEGDKKVNGYPYFYTRFEFDGDENFQAIGAWE